jgi:hypothetical protein
MTTDEDNNNTKKTTHTDIRLIYESASRLTQTDETGHLHFFGNIKRDNVALSGKIHEPLTLREGLSTLYSIVGSDYRYVPKDRSAYQAYRRMRNESANKGIWQAQQEYFSWLQRNDPTAFLILDPIISVHPDQCFLEVFSKDEGTYAKLDIHMDAIERSGDIVCGSTNIDFSEALAQSIEQFRSYRDNHIHIGQSGVKVSIDGNEHLEKNIQLPDSWLRGFLQVQSATLLPLEKFSLAPLDIYNLLRQLRLNGDIKGQRRGLRVELLPGEKPRLVLEPWEVVIQSSAAEYKGTQSKVIRLWGRRRLSLLHRLLPFIEKIDVYTAGSGLPSFWVFRCTHMTLTLGLTGFTASDWSQACAFDLLMKRDTDSSGNLNKIVRYLSTNWFADLSSLTEAMGIKKSDLHQALQLGCQLGQLIYDLANDVYRLRPLTGQPLALERLEYRNPNEKLAHDLNTRKKAVTIVSENRIPGKGTEIVGEVEVKEDKREYRPLILLNDEGLLRKAECTCTHYRNQGLKAGPCAHLIALRQAYAKIEHNRRSNSQTRQTITVETRRYSIRRRGVEKIVQLSLDRRKFTIRWGEAGKPLRSQRLQFNTVPQARNEYLQRIEHLQTQGYLDASE